MTEINDDDLSKEVCQVVISVASILQGLRTQREERPLKLYQ